MANHRDRVDRTRQTTIQLFGNRDREQCDIVSNEAWTSFSLRSYTPQMVITSPTAKRTTPVPPNAPIKPRKAFSKEGLKPKKLRFTDKEKDETEDKNCYQKGADFSIKMFKQNCRSNRTNRNVKAEFSKQQGESKERVDRESLSVMLQSIRLELDNKENRRHGHGRYEKRTKNNRSVVKERARSSNNCSSQSSKLNRSPKDFGKCPTTLSPCNDTWNKEEKLLWLQQRRDVGMWIQCCRKNCKKLRYCDDFHDPVDVPKIWYCEMNSNVTIASCFVSEVSISKEVNEDLIENKYNAGSLVWGRVDDGIWWPAIVDDCPETLRFYQLNETSIIPVKYHVTFFKNNLQRAWLNLKNIKAFIKCKKDTLVRKRKRLNEVNYNKSLEEACALAQSALPLSIFERLQRFSYISRLKNLKGSIIQSYESQDDEISSTPTRSIEHITLKEFYSKNKHYAKNKFSLAKNL